MGNFKVGDRVRRVSQSDYPESYGHVGRDYTVLGVEGRYGIVVVEGCGSAAADRFELTPSTAEAVSGAIRTVTRREIVPGVYGGVDIDDLFGDAPAISIPRRIFTPTELREAAHLLNQIAEVLEENAALEMKEAA